MPIHSSLNRPAAWLLVFWCAVCAGCADETGLLVEVTRDPATTSDAIDELRFFIGTRKASAVFVEDDDPLRTVELDGGRDLLADPYRLLLRDGDSGRDDELLVAVIGYVGGEVDALGAFDSARRFEEGKVMQWPVVLQGRSDVPVTDTGCLVLDTGTIAPADDKDCDGDRAPADCNDLDPDVGPSVQERCDNGVDDNCDTVIDEEVDGDGDGFTNCEECDDADRFVNPDAEEVCDGRDNDCDKTCDREFDEDEDDYTTCGSKLVDGGSDCLAPTDERVDCDDTREDVHPNAEEVCDGRDNDCNEVCDDGFDPDLDLFTECGSRVDKCAGTDSRDVDCAPADGEVHPGAPERCNGVDDDCDGVPYPDSSPCYGLDTTMGGADVCIVGVRTCDDDPGGAGWGDCVTEGRVGDEAFHAPVELCTAYESCDDGGAPDPFECAGGMVTTTSASCTVYVEDPVEGTLCPNTLAPIPSADRAGCMWTVIGGMVQRHYEVGLSMLAAIDVPPDTPAVGVIDACAVWFEVVTAYDAPPMHDGVLLWHRDAANPTGLLIDVQLAPMSAVSCPEVGLECAGFPVLTPGG